METRVKTGYVNARDAVRVAFMAAQSNQDEPASLAAAGVFALFAQYTESLGINPADAYERGRALLANGDISREVSALREFIAYTKGVSK